MTTTSNGCYLSLDELSMINGFLYSILELFHATCLKNHATSYFPVLKGTGPSSQVKLEVFKYLKNFLVKRWLCLRNIGSLAFAILTPVTVDSK